MGNNKDRKKLKREREKRERARSQAREQTRKQCGEKKFAELQKRVEKARNRFYADAATGKGPTRIQCPCMDIAADLGIKLPNVCDGYWGWESAGAPVTIPLTGDPETDLEALSSTLSLAMSGQDEDDIFGQADQQNASEN